MRESLFFVLGFAVFSGYVQAQALAIGPEAWHAVPDARGVQVIHIDCSEGIFDPSEIVVKGNRPVELMIRSRDGDTREFVSDFTPRGKAIGKQASPQRFTPTASGKFDLACEHQGGGKAKGTGKVDKKGKLFVVQDRTIN